VLKSVDVITGFEDIAIMGQSIQQGYSHLRTNKHGRPFREAQFGGDNDTGLLVEPADKMEQQSATGCPVTDGMDTALP
jgi:hypothetical protein